MRVVTGTAAVMLLGSLVLAASPDAFATRPTEAAPRHGSAAHAHGNGHGNQKPDHVPPGQAKKDKGG